MSTIVNNPGPERVVTVERAEDSTAGWAVAVIVLIAVVVGLIVWYHYHHAAYVAPAQGGDSTGSINITLPAGNGGNPSSNASGGTTVGNGN